MWPIVVKSLSGRWGGQWDALIIGENAEGHHCGSVVCYAEPGEPLLKPEDDWRARGLAVLANQDYGLPVVYTVTISPDGPPIVARYMTRELAFFGVQIDNQVEEGIAGATKPLRAGEFVPGDHCAGCAGCANAVCPALNDAAGLAVVLTDYDPIPLRELDDETFAALRARMREASRVQAAVEAEHKRRTGQPVEA